MPGFRRKRRAGAKPLPKPGHGAYSLRRRLISTTLGSSIAVGVVSTVIVLAIAWKEVSDTFDDSLEEGARLVLALGEGTSVAGMPARDRDDAEPALRLDYQIISRGGEVIARGDDAPKRPFVDPERKDDRFYDVRADGERWRVYVREHENEQFSVQVGQEWDDRTDLIVDMLKSLAWPLIGLWLLLGLVNGWLIRRMLAPLERLARDMEAKAPADLSPLVYGGKAQEVRTVVTALNRLLGRLSQTLEGERRFTADAAHELRTPLAALASRIQVMQRSIPMEGPAAVQLRRLREDVARSTALVENLLQLARLDPQSAEALVTEVVDTRELIDEVVRACGPAALARGVIVSVDCRVATATGNREGLATALRNLLHNAIIYGRAGGRVEVSVQRQGSALAFVVRDDGDGVAPADLERLTQRFYRVLGSETQGSGLGLSIVARIAELHRATLSFGKGLEGRGLGVTLLLPAQGAR